MATPRRNRFGQFVKSGHHTTKRRNPSKGTYCARCKKHHRSAATAARAHKR